MNDWHSFPLFWSLNIFQRCQLDGVQVRDLVGVFSMLASPYMLVWLKTGPRAHLNVFAKVMIIFSTALARRTQIPSHWEISTYVFFRHIILLLYIFLILSWYSSIGTGVLPSTTPCPTYSTCFPQICILITYKVHSLHSKDKQVNLDEPLIRYYAFTPWQAFTFISHILIHWAFTVMLWVTYHY